MDARNGTRAKRARRARAQQLYVRNFIGESVNLQEEQPDVTAVEQLARLRGADDKNTAQVVSHCDVLLQRGQEPTAVEHMQPMYESTDGTSVAIGWFNPVEHWPTLQSLKGTLRRLVVGNYCKELDLKASLQTVALELVGADGDKAGLDDYVRNKKERVASLAQAVGSSEKEAKEMFVQRITFGGSLNEAIGEAHKEGFNVALHQLPQWITTFASALSKLPDRLKSTLPDMYAHAEAIAHTKGKSSGSAMSYVLQQAEAEFLYTAISELKGMCIEPVGLIHDDADALHIDTLNAKLRSKLSFERMAFDLKGQAPTEEDKQWLQQVVTQHSGTVLPHDEALVSRCVRKFLSDRAATVDLPPLDIVRAVQPALVGHVVYSHPFWLYTDKRIVRLCDSASKCTESEWFNPLLVRLLEQAFRDAINEQEDAVEKLKQQMQQVNERKKLEETVKATKATMTKPERLRDRYLSPDTLRKISEALATESMMAVTWY